MSGFYIKIPNVKAADFKRLDHETHQLQSAQKPEKCINKKSGKELEITFKEDQYLVKNLDPEQDYLVIYPSVTLWRCLEMELLK